VSIKLELSGVIFLPCGHYNIIRMEEERIPKKILNGNFHTTRPVGRPRTRWADVVQRDAQQLLGIRGRRRRAVKTDEWRHLMSKAKPRTGLWRHSWKWGGESRPFKV
jgi:hypothetical protein